MRQPLAQNKSNLKRRSDFLSTYKGQILRKRFCSLYWIKKSHRSIRFGITVPKTTGTAVIRNRLKRWAREGFKSMRWEEIIGCDLHLFIGNKRWSKDNYKKLEKVTFDSELNSAFSDFKKAWFEKYNSEVNTNL